MPIDPQNHAAAAGDELISAAPSRLLRGLATLLLAAAAGALVSHPLATWLPRQAHVDAMLKVENGVLTASMTTSMSQAIVSRARNHTDPAPVRHGDADAGAFSLSAMILDTLLGEAPAASDQQRTVGDIAPESVELVLANAGRRLVVRAAAADPTAATAIANSVATELVDNPAAWLPVAPDEKLVGLKAAAEKARREFDAVRAGTAKEALAAAGRAGSAEQIAQQEIGALEARIIQLDEQVQEAASMTSADVLQQSLPDRLEFTGLEYHRQRHVEAKLAFDQRSRQLGPRHPNLLATKGALDSVKADIDRELVKLVKGLEAQKADVLRQLADIKGRQPAASPETRSLRAKLDSLEEAARTAEESYEEAALATQADDAESPLSLTLVAPAEPERAVTTGWTLRGAMTTGALMGILIPVVLSLVRRRPRQPSRSILMDGGEGGMFERDARETAETHPVDMGGADDDPASSRPVDEAPLAERIRQILYDNAAPADRPEFLPPLVASAIAGDARYLVGDDVTSGGTLQPPNNDQRIERELWELHDQLAALRGRVQRRSATGR